jgi:peptidoglycan/LPS O-acetylase OafA/YrhL
MLYFAFFGFLSIFASYQVARLALSLGFFPDIGRSAGRFGCLDGVRGYLALMVFVHHFIITYYWQETGSWSAGFSIVVENLGHVAVSIFFMITGFLFLNKIFLDDEVSWLKLYESRIFRIYPLYLFSIFLVVLICFQNSSGNMSGVEFLVSVFRWLTITQGGEHGRFWDYENSTLIVAGVFWTLRYEWLFYFCLPLLYFFKGNVWLVLLGFFLFLLLYFFKYSVFGFRFEYLILFPFGGGVAYLKYKRVFDGFVFSGNMMSFLLLALFLLSIFSDRHDDVGRFVSLSCIVFSFFLIANGVDLFGFLKTKPSLLLGEVSYSIYLIHGILLFVFSSVIGVLNSTMGFFEYAFFMPLVSVLVCVATFFTYYFIEKPGVMLGRKYIFTRCFDRLLVKLMNR